MANDPFKSMSEELKQEILSRREVRFLSFSNFVGREMGKDTEVYRGTDIRQVRAIGIILHLKDTKVRVLIPWNRVIDFTYHERDPLMWLPGAGQ